MPLPEFNAEGDLPPGVHRATIQEVVASFSGSTPARRQCTRNLTHVHELVKSTGHPDRFVIFGSYVTDKPSPNDIDLILVMDDEFHVDRVPLETRGLFEHAVAQPRFGASVFWIKRSSVVGEALDDFIAYWQQKRDGTLRGIAEVL